MAILLQRKRYIFEKKMKKILQIKKIPFIFFAVAVFLLLNIFFNFKIFKEDVFGYNPQKVTIDDGVVTEFLTDLEYRRLQSFKNPFSPTNALFYPFTTPIALNDTSAMNLLFFPILRPFFNIHQTTLVIAIFNIFLSNLLMYFLLKRLRVHQYAAFLGSLIFGFTPYIISAITGHYTYTALYFFPLLFLTAYEFIQSVSLRKKLLFSCFFGIFLGASLYTNPYYFIISALGIVLYSLLFFFLKRKEFIGFFLKNIVYFFISCAFFFFVLFPLLTEMKKAIDLYGSSAKVHVGSSIVLSSDLFNLVIPNEQNPLYNLIFTKLANAPLPFSKISHFFFYSWYSFSYPGILILLTGAFFIIYWKKLEKEIKDRIEPHLFASAAFFILMLGPFLKLFNRWMIVLDENIPVYIPLPFLLLRFIPGLETLRAPVRFVTVFVFLAAIVFALLFDWVLKRTEKKKQILLLLLFFAIFFLDQMYVIRDRISTNIPLRIYEYIKQDKKQSTVLEIPFTVRDGLQYAGFVHATSIMRSPLLHNKPIIGGYLSRVHPSVFEYYRNLPFIGHTAEIIDKGNYHLYKEQPASVKITPYTENILLMKDEFDFLDIKYIILKNDEAYTAPIEKIISDVGFKKKLTDQAYDLFERIIEVKNFDNVRFGSDNDRMYAGIGFDKRENGFRRITDKIATIFLKSFDADKKILVIDAASVQSGQTAKVFVNGLYIKTISFDAKRKYVSLDVSSGLKQGMNEILMVFSDTGLQFFSVKLD